MSALIHQRCSIHAGREAVVRCPQCRRFFCRECVTEHHGRMICASCLAEAVRGSPKAGGWRAALWTALAAGGFLLAWLIFYYFGMLLGRIPSDFFSEMSPSGPARNALHDCRASQRPVEARQSWSALVRL